MHQVRLVIALKNRGERVCGRNAGGWILMTRSDGNGWYHIGPNGELRLGAEPERSFAVPWIARRLLREYASTDRWRDRCETRTERRTASQG